MPATWPRDSPGPPGPRSPNSWRPWPAFASSAVRRRSLPPGLAFPPFKFPETCTWGIQSPPGKRSQGLQARGHPVARWCRSGPRCRAPSRTAKIGVRAMIERLYIHNFRCLQNFELVTRGIPTALLIGGNGSGKSSVRQVLELLQSVGRGTNRVGELVRPRTCPRPFGRPDTVRDRGADRPTTIQVCPGSGIAR